MRTNGLNKTGYKVAASCLLIAALWPCGQALAQNHKLTQEQIQKRAQAARDLQKLTDGLRSLAAQHNTYRPFLAQAAATKPEVKNADGVKADADQPKDKGKNKAEDNDKTPDFNFQFRPSSVQSSTNLNFDQDGKVNNSSESLNVSFRVKFDAGKLRPIMVKNIQATKVMTDTLESLTSRSRSGDQALFSWENQGNANQSQRSEFYLSLSFGTPVKPAQELVEISGTMDVLYARGQPSEAVLKPFSDFEGKRVTFKSLPGQYLMFTRGQQRGGNRSSIRVEMPRGFRPYLARVTFYDEAGHQLNYNSWGGGSSGATEYRNLGVDLPEKGQIRVEIYPHVETKQIPFTIKHIPLVKPGKKAQAGDVMVELKPVAPINAIIKLQRLDAVVDQ